MSRLMNLKKKNVEMWKFIYIVNKFNNLRLPQISVLVPFFCGNSLKASIDANFDSTKMCDRTLQII